MSVIENFVGLSAQEQRAFAETLVKTINTEKTFIDDELKLITVGADELTGDLLIELECVTSVERRATWTCSNDEDAAYEKPQYPEYEEYESKDAEKAFKTLSAELNGYTLTLDVADADGEAIEEVRVDSISREDAGIGHYEYWGFEGYDSQPYTEVEGTLVQTCKVYLGLFVEPTTTVPEEASEETE
jgi:hypothetical protein